VYFHDTYFIVAHFHYVLFGATLFGVFAAIQYWFPKMFGRMMNEKLGKTHFMLTFIGANGTFFPMHFLGLAGMPRRIPDYSTQFSDFNSVASIGAIGFGLSQLLFVYIVYQCAQKKAPKATTAVWDNPQGLEWTVPSPAPYHTFDTPPRITSSTAFS
ncbi:MAG: cytochrome c oxidase subunit I, partial [Planctomycetaceae bacterium]|nr:cytochrome c oxidase subunit I [Planctomycetaceae bacterium]